jgi:hypothetical protein
MFWERQSRAERREILFEIQKALCQHHRDEKSRQAHPEGGFLMPELNASKSNGVRTAPGETIRRSSEAAPGHPPSWAL